MTTPTAAPLQALNSASRLSFPPLSIVREGEDYLVGDPKTATFIAIPEVGVIALRQLQTGITIAEASAATAAGIGEPADVLQFASGLVASGLVSAVDGAPLASGAGVAERRWLQFVRPEWAAPLFSRPAWVIYGLLLTLCLGVFAIAPAYWPSFEDFFFYPDPAVSIVVLALASFGLGAVHEIFHWLAARAAGVAASIQVSRRLYLPVFETDLSQLWAVPRSRRYSPFLAGMAFDVAVLALSLMLRLASAAGVLDLAPLLVRFLAAIALMQVLDLGWQFLVFLRTDLYAVMVTALGCRNLTRITNLSLKRRVVRLRAPEDVEYGTAHPRDLAVARWFGLVYFAGLALMLWYFIQFFVPSTVIMAGWMFGAITGAPIGSRGFWEALSIGLVAASNVVAPIAILAWQKYRGREAS